MPTYFIGQVSITRGMGRGERFRRVDIKLTRGTWDFHLGLATHLHESQLTIGQLNLTTNCKH
jgi:hypothetical protein